MPSTLPPATAGLSITDLEQAINYWRTVRPSIGEECALSPEVNVLADLYARMIIGHAHDIALDAATNEQRQLLDAWRKAHAPGQQSL